MKEVSRRARSRPLMVGTSSPKHSVAPRLRGSTIHALELHRARAAAWVWPPPTQGVRTCASLWVIFVLGVALELRRIKVHLPERPLRRANGLVVEVRRCGIGACAAGCDGARANLVAELDDGNEAVARRAIVFLSAFVAPCTERRQRSPPRRWKAYGNTGCAIHETLGDFARQALEAV